MPHDWLQNPRIRAAYEAQALANAPTPAARETTRAAPSTLALAADPPDRMNKTEREYALQLDALLRNGELLHWSFAEIGFRLGHNCFYYPDFYTILANREIQIDEIKGGHITDDGLAKFKAAADRFPFFRWRLIQKTKSGWSVRFSSHPQPSANPKSKI